MTEQPTIVRHATIDQLFARLKALDINVKTLHHPPVFTVEEAKNLRGPIVGGHCKSLFLRDKKKKSWLVVALENTRVDLKFLANQLNCKHFSFSSRETLHQILGVSPGSVTPFALINDLQTQVGVVIDAALLQINPVNFHPLRNDMTTAITPQDLMCFIRSCGHEPQILNMVPVAVNHKL